MNGIKIIRKAILLAISVMGSQLIMAQDTYYFTVNVKPEYPEYHVNGLPVELFTPDDSTTPYQTQDLNEDGNADFKDLPKGTYIVHVDGTPRGLSEFTGQVETTGESQHFYITLKEKLIQPFSLAADVTEMDNGLYSVTFTWNDHGKYHYPYMYCIQINGEGEYMTDSYSYTFENLKPGTYLFSVKAWNGMFDYTEPATLEVTIPSNSLGDTDSVKTIESAPSSWQYFNLDGIPVAPSSPGLYLLTNGKTTQKVLVK